MSVTAASGFWPGAQKKCFGLAGTSAEARDAACAPSALQSRIANEMASTVRRAELIESS